MLAVKGSNDNDPAQDEGNLVEGQKLAKLVIDITGLIQNKFLDVRCGRHADIILEVRHLLGQVFDIPVIEMNREALHSDLSRQIQYYNLFETAS